MPRRYKLCCLTKNKTNPAYVGAQIGAARLAGQLGSDIVAFAPEKPDDLDEQLGNIRDAMALRPDAILISPVDATLLDTALQAVRDAGIVLVYSVTASEARSGRLLRDIRQLCAGRRDRDVSGRSSWRPRQGRDPRRAGAIADLAAAIEGFSRGRRRGARHRAGCRRLGSLPVCRRQDRDGPHPGRAAASRWRHRRQ